MLNIFPYYLMVLFIIYLTIISFISNIKKSPKKIKVSFAIMLALTFFRQVTILLCGLVSKQEYLNIVKPASFLYFLYVPIIVLICFYIFWRNDKVKFTKVNILSLILFAIYFITILLFKPYFKASWHYGYIITTDNDVVFKAIYILILMGILSFIILSKKNSYCNSKGIILLIMVVVAIMIENSLYLVGIYYFPNCIISEVLLLLTCSYGISTFKRSVNGKF